MLSPSISTKSNGNFSRHATICRATSCCASIAAAGVADDGESNRAGVHRQRELAWTRRQLADRRRRGPPRVGGDRALAAGAERRAPARPRRLQRRGADTQRPHYRGSQPSATNCTSTWPRFGASVTGSSSGALDRSPRRCVCVSSADLSRRARGSARARPRRFPTRASRLTASFIVRPTPRAAVVARPSVPVLIALRPSSAPDDRRAERQRPSASSAGTPARTRARPPASARRSRLGERRLLRRVLAPHRVDRFVARRRASASCSANPEVALGLLGLSTSASTRDGGAARSSRSGASHRLKAFCQTA